MEGHESHPWNDARQPEPLSAASLQRGIDAIRNAPDSCDMHRGDVISLREWREHCNTTPTLPEWRKAFVILVAEVMESRTRRRKEVNRRLER